MHTYFGMDKVERLIAKLNDSNWIVRRDAAEALGEIGDARAVEPLIAALRDEEGHVKNAAAKALGRIGDNRAIEPLIAELDKYGSGVRESAAEALGKIGKPAVDPLIAVLRNSRLSVCEAAEALGEIGDARAVEPLIAVLGNSDSRYVMGKVVEALGKIGDDRAIEPLIAALALSNLESDSDYLVKFIMVALNKIDPAWQQTEASHRQVSKFIAAMSDSKSNNSRGSAWALGEIGGLRAVEPLIASLRDAESSVMDIAAKALGKIGNPRAVEPLIALLRDSDSNVRSCADWALNKIDPTWPQSKNARQQVPEFIATLGHSDWSDWTRSISMCAAKTLGKIGEPRAVEPLIAVLRNILSISHSLKEQEGYIQSMCYYDEWDSEQDSRYRLVNSYNDHANSISYCKSTVIEALFNINKIGKPAVDPLIAELRHRNSYFRAEVASELNRIDPAWPQSEAARQQVPEFIAALSDSDSGIRQYAAEVLGKIGDARAIKSLLVLLRDQHPWVRSNAKTALEQVLKKANALIQNLLQNYPHLYCKTCLSRSEKKHVRIGFMRWITLIRCRSCENLTDLITNFRVVVGFIGGDGEDFAQQGDTVHARLWDEATGQSRNADIDRLLIRHGGVEQYDLAIDKLINTLKNDATRPLRWCNRIPVEVEAGVNLPVGAMTMLKNTFKSVSTL